MRHLTSAATFRLRSRSVEAVGFAVLLVGLFLVWQPLGWIVLGVAAITYAQLMRR